MPKLDIFKGQTPSSFFYFGRKDLYEKARNFDPTHFDPTTADWELLGYMAIANTSGDGKLASFYKDFLPEYPETDRTYPVFASKVLKDALRFETDPNKQRQLHFLIGRALILRLKNAQLPNVIEIESEYSRIIEHFENAGKYGIFSRATLLLEGKGYTYNAKRAVMLLKESADNGDKNALYAYGLILITGKYLNIDVSAYVEKDFDRGVELLKKAAEEGNSSAQFFLGELYRGELLYPSYFGEPEHYLNDEPDSKTKAEFYFKESLDSIPLAHYCLYVLNTEEYAGFKDKAIATLKKEQKRAGYFSTMATYFLSTLETDINKIDRIVYNHENDIIITNPIFKDIYNNTFSKLEDTEKNPLQEIVNTLSTSDLLRLTSTLFHSSQKTITKKLKSDPKNTNVLDAEWCSPINVAYPVLLISQKLVKMTSSITGAQLNQARLLLVASKIRLFMLCDRLHLERTNIIPDKNLITHRKKFNPSPEQKKSYLSSAYQHLKDIIDGDCDDFKPDAIELLKRLKAYDYPPLQECLSEYIKKSEPVIIAKSAPTPVAPIVMATQDDNQSEVDAGEFMPPDMGENAVLLGAVKKIEKLPKPTLTIEITDERLEKPLESPNTPSPT